MTCHRLDDEEWLDALTEGHPHVEQCPDCRRTLASYAQITAALAGESTREVPSDWMERMQARLKESSPPAEPRASGSSPRMPRPSPDVIAAPQGGATLDSGNNASPRRRWMGWTMGMSGASAAAAIAMATITTGPAAGFLRSTYEKGAAMYRGAEDVPHSGGTLHLSAGPGDAEHFSLRVYHDSDRLVLDCAGPTGPCTEGEDGGVEAAYLLPAPGVYDIYLLTSASKVASPIGSLEEDLEAAFQSGAKIFSKRRHDVY